MTNIEDLLGRVNRLKAILEDPHPGLYVWRQAYADASKDLLAFYDEGEGYEQKTRDQRIWDAAVQQCIGDMERAAASIAVPPGYVGFIRFEPIPFKAHEPKFGDGTIRGESKNPL